MYNIGIKGCLRTMSNVAVLFHEFHFYGGI